ncbi:MAG: hypothetical protein EXR99_03125 [Gemmataceae bacterium]|nr:hypothetical protein [Gemmataceae bacterium]
MGQIIRLETFHEGLHRLALLRKPANFKPPGPLILMLHGAGGTASWTLEETGWGRLADRVNALLLLPEGTRADLKKAPGFLKNPQVWNDGSPRSEMGQPGVNDLAYLDQLLQQVGSLGLAQKDRFFLTGFSNGTGMAFRYAVHGKKKPAGFGPVSGLCLVDDYPHNLAIPTLFIAGSQDPLIPLDGGPIQSPWTGKTEIRSGVMETIKKWELALGGAAETEEKSLPSAICIERLCGKKRTPFHTIILAGLGHHWPGGKGTLNKRLAGNPSNQINACETLWAFWNIK